VISYRWIIGALWVIFILVWLVTAFGAKRSVSRIDWGRQAQLRLAAALLIALVVRVVFHTQVWQRAHRLVFVDPRLGITGVILCGLGIAIAIWARVYIGRNWGPPMSRKEAPELVTSGPYAYVRHPIYAGIFLAMIGSALGDSVLWLIPFAIAGAYFVYAARTEEHILEQEFPEQYAAYRRRTKMLVPFVL
jgi:protein-S-isoprenylcysteine O-methyltransferase Ste14